MKKIFTLILLMMSLCSCTSYASQGYPKLVVYWMSVSMDSDDVENLAKYDMVIADMENIVNNPKSLYRLKSLNPEIKLLAYSNPMEFFSSTQLDIKNYFGDDLKLERSLQKKMHDEVVKNMPEWYLSQPNGKHVVFYKDMEMLNLGINCPVVNGQKWNQYVANFLLKNVLDNDIWDGYFMDNSGGNVWWIGNGYNGNKGIDANRDGIADEQLFLDGSWSTGIREFLSIIRNKKGEDFIIVGNKGSVEFTDIVNGKMFEEFPNNYLGDTRANGWYQSMINYERTGQYSVIHAGSGYNDDQYRLFVMTSAMLGDGYYAYGNGISWWFPEYSKKIGHPVGEKVKNGDFFEREFEKGTVRVWPEQEVGQIVYK